MTNDEKISQMALMLGEEKNTELFSTYLNVAKQKILNRRFPFGTTNNDVESCFEQLQIELAIVLYNESGVEGQSSHSENGVSRVWRTESQILEEITPIGVAL